MPSDRTARVAPIAVSPVLLVAVLLLAAGCGRTNLMSDGTIGTDAGGGFDATPGTDAMVECTGDDECSDGSLCTGVERCEEGVCVGGGPVSCDDDVSCTIDGCDDSVGCVHMPDHDQCDPGEICDAAAGCQDVPCSGPGDCDDGFFCNGLEVCVAGFCAPSMPPACIDALGCTVDACDPVADACVNTADDALCDNGLFCDGEELCVVPFGCTSGQTVDCTDGDGCTLDVCNENIDICMHSPRDLDGDSFGDAMCGGSDCNDLDPTINPGAAELCTDNTDNDCNGDVDCDDTACATLPICTMTCDPFESACADGFDDDCDGATDCADPDCDGVPPCPAMCAPGETCGNAIDDDCDGLTDCLDPECAAAPGCGPMCMPFEACANGVDDDCDTLTDCDDPACVGDPACVICLPTEVCLNVTDDDCDGDVDCADADCSNSIFCIICLPVEICSGGGDEDCDGDVDCDDSQCMFDPACSPGCGVESCTNLQDDDCDGIIDCVDPDCAGDFFCDFCIGFEICFGLRDEDCDGLYDCGDPDCAGDISCLACQPESCTNTADDDCDGYIDCADPDCAGAMSCGEVCTPDGVLNCGDSQPWANFSPGSSDVVEGYACGATGQTADEYTYTFVPGITGTAIVTVSGLLDDLNLFVLDAGPGAGPCDPGDCAASAVTPGIVDETATFPVVSGNTYYIVVDGPAGVISPYVIDLQCM